MMIDTETVRALNLLNGVTSSVEIKKCATLFVTEPSLLEK